MLGKVKYALGTLLGRPRRWRYLEQVAKGGVGAEIGVFRGEFTPHLLRVTRPRHLHLIDGWWTLYGERYPDWGAYTEHGALETRRAYEETLRRVDGAPCTIHVGDDVEILARFPDHHFDWVYLDTSHQYDHTRRELEVLRDRVKPAGVILGDDWKEDPGHVNHGCSVAVSEFCAREGWALGAIDSFSQWSIRRR